MAGAGQSEMATLWQRDLKWMTSYPFVQLDGVAGLLEMTDLSDHVSNLMEIKTVG